MNIKPWSFFISYFYVLIIFIKYYFYHINFNSVYRNISGGVFSKIEVENNDITLREILSRTIARRREMAKIIGKLLFLWVEYIDYFYFLIKVFKYYLIIELMFFSKFNLNRGRCWLSPGKRRWTRSYFMFR